MQTARITGPVIPTRATVGDEDIIIVISIIMVITAAIGTDATGPPASVVHGPTVSTTGTTPAIFGAKRFFQMGLDKRANQQSAPFDPPIPESYFLALSN